MSEREELLQELMDVIGEEGCGVSCEEASTQTVSRCSQPLIRAPAHHFHDRGGLKGHECLTQKSV